MSVMWTEVEDSYNGEYTATINGHSVILYSDYHGIVWSYRIDGADVCLSLYATTLYSAKCEVEREMQLM